MGRSGTAQGCGCRHGRSGKWQEKDFFQKKLGNSCFKQ
nr:MAG TPA: hypothetical protein [Caudoviricetes sp.]DAX51818.1 MAG TPA: hypothetical protein [Caudoviricetes sp.]